MLQVIVSVWFINYVGAESYGRYAYAVSFAALFGTLASLGLDVIVIRERGDRRASGRSIGIQVTPDLIEDIADVVGSDCVSFTRR